MTRETRGFSRVEAGFSSYNGEFRLPLVLAQEVQSSIQLVTESCGLLSSHFRAKSPHLGLGPGRNVPLSRGNRDIGVAFQSHPVGHTSSRVEAKDSTTQHLRLPSILAPGTFGNLDWIPPTTAKVLQGWPMTLELVQSPIALGSKVMGGVVLTEGKEGISLAQEQSSHHSPFMIRSWR